MADSFTGAPTTITSVLGGGVVRTSVFAAPDPVAAIIAAELDAHAAETTDVHGIADTSALVVKADLPLNVNDYGTPFSIGAINAALAAAAPGQTVRMPAGTYTIPAGDLPNAIRVMITKDGVTLEADPGAVIDATALHASDIVIGATGTCAINLDTVAADIARGARTIAVGNGAQFAVGDLIIIRSENEAFNNQRPAYLKSELAEIEAVSGNNVTLVSPTSDSYLAASTVKVDRITPVRNLTLRNLQIVADTPSRTNTRVGIKINYIDGALIENCRIDGMELQGIAVQNSRNVRTTGCSVNRVFSTSGGYGIHYGGVVDGTIANNVVTNCRHCIEAGGQGNIVNYYLPINNGTVQQGGMFLSRGTSITGNNVSGSTSSGISTHGGSESTVISGNTVRASGGGIITRGPRTTVVGNDVTAVWDSDTESYGRAYFAGDYTPNAYGTGRSGEKLIISGNRFESVVGPGDAAARVGTTANIVLSAPQTIDGVAVVAGDRVLVKDQTNAVENGVWVVAAGAWARAADVLVPGYTVALTEGTSQGTFKYAIYTTGAIVVGTTALTITRVAMDGMFFSDTLVDCLISNNVITGHTRHGIQIVGNNSNHVNISNNIFNESNVENPGAAVGASAVRSHAILIAPKDAATGATTTNLTIDGNRFTSGMYSTIYIVGPTTGFGGTPCTFKITNNVLSYGRFGFVITSAGDYGLRIITGNVLIGDPASTSINTLIQLGGSSAIAWVLWPNIIQANSGRQALGPTGWGSVAPASGQRVVGDFTVSTAPGIAAPLGWYTTASGAPGTQTPDHLVNRPVSGVAAQTLAANGAVTLNAASGETHRVTLQANATSMTITNPIDGQKMYLDLIQDATGGRTVVLPTNIVWAGGAAPVLPTTASARSKLTLEYNATTAKWEEVARALTLG